jgi:hypothetical protein
MGAKEAAVGTCRCGSSGGTARAIRASGPQQDRAGPVLPQPRPLLHKAVARPSVATAVQTATTAAAELPQRDTRPHAIALRHGVQLLDNSFPEGGPAGGGWVDCVARSDRHAADHDVTRMTPACPRRPLSESVGGGHARERRDDGDGRYPRFARDTHYALYILTSLPPRSHSRMLIGTLLLSHLPSDSDIFPAVDYSR